MGNFKKVLWDFEAIFLGFQAVKADFQAVKADFLRSDNYFSQRLADSPEVSGCDKV